MGDFLSKLFRSDFMGHGYCYLWRPEIVWLHAVSDGLIALSYYVIPLMLVYLVRKRRDLPFHWMFFMFGVFILGCGTTHIMELWTLWNGTYRLAGIIKAITAAASLATAVALVPLVPRALLLPSPAQLRAANARLEAEIDERLRAQEALQKQQGFVDAVLNTIDTLIVVLDVDGGIVQCNRAAEQTAGRQTHELKGQPARDFFAAPVEAGRFEVMLGRLRSGQRTEAFEAHSVAGSRLISWDATALTDSTGKTINVIAAGVDITEAKRLERAVLDISAREQRRIGQDLHDGLGQHLTGIAFLSKALEQKLADTGSETVADAAKIVALVNSAIDKTRELSKGLLPVPADPLGLMSALDRWSSEVEQMFAIDCLFYCPRAVRLPNPEAATHLYRIAQEAVNNAIRHGRASHIEINLLAKSEGIVLTIQDNGAGFAPGAARGKGMGLQIMDYRAKMIGGTLTVAPCPEGGTLVTCHARPDGD